MAARTRKMKFGTSVLALPLRNPTVLAKELATLDFLSGGRLLLAVGLGRDDDTELQACGIHRSERAGRTEEMVHLLRALWSGERSQLSRKVLPAPGRLHRSQAGPGRPSHLGRRKKRSPPSAAPPASPMVGWAPR